MRTSLLVDCAPSLLQVDLKHVLEGGYLSEQWWQEWSEGRQ